jgi:PAS domain S-box-containing protein
MAGGVRANHNLLSEPVDDRLFRLLADNIPALCWIADPSGYILWYNPRWYQYTGTTPAQMQGWGWQAVHEPRNLAAVLERWSEAIGAAQPFEMVFPIRGADGVFRPFLTRINPTFDVQGRVTHWFGVNTDISPQLKAEDLAAKTDARFRLIADSMPQMVWAADAAGAADYFNARWYEFTGVPIGSTDGDGWIPLLHPDDVIRRRTHGGSRSAAVRPIARSTGCAIIRARIDGYWRTLSPNAMPRVKSPAGTGRTPISRTSSRRGACCSAHATRSSWRSSPVPASETSWQAWWKPRTSWSWRSI